MHFDIVTDTYPPDINGVAMTLGRLCDGLRARGHEVGLINSGADRDDTGRMACSYVPMPGYKEVRIGLPKPIKLKKHWKKRRPDAVYVATESPLGLSAVKAARKLDIPVVMGFHTNFDQYLERYNLGGLQSTATTYLRRVHNQAARTLVPSPDAAKRLLNLGFENVELLGRGVDTTLFDPRQRRPDLRARWGATPQDPVLILVGRVAPEKNLELGLQTYEALRKKHPSLKAVVVGDGPSRAQLEQAHPDVNFAGMKTGESLAAHYASADLLLFPSETETFGNVLLEAMASGLPTVSYRYAASAHHIEDHKNGRHVPLGDRQAFQQATADLLAIPPEARQRLGAAARQQVETLGWDRIIETFERHLTEVCQVVETRRASVPSPPFRSGKYLVRTLILSDIHLGSRDSKADEASHFLKHFDCEKLILNGDIIDGWALERGSKWRKSHTRFVRTVLKKLEKDDTEVFYLRGNHDEVIERFLPFVLGKMKVLKEHRHHAHNGRQYLVVHGDGFDSVSSGHSWLAKIGSICYDQLMVFNRFYNRYRAWRGKEYFSLSQAVKAKVKATVAFVDKYEEQLQNLARHRKCDGIICGHIHTPADEVVGDVHYLNSGDWVESLTAIVEHLDGRFEIVSFDDFTSWQNERQRENAQEPEETSTSPSPAHPAPKALAASA